MTHNRRFFLRTSLLAAMAAGGPGAASGGGNLRAPKILLRSSWQVVNIGDIAHTPGVLALIEQQLPEAEVILWASGDLTEEVAAMEHRRFPKLKIVKGTIRADGTASNADLSAAIEWCDFLLHGSGPSLVAEKDVAAFVQHTEKPFGVFGITWSGGSDDAVALLSKAKFVFFRDSLSLNRAKQQGVSSPVMEFGPDGAFSADLRDDSTADSFLAASGLEPDKFLCCISRLRFTPYWLIKKERPFDEKRHARNEQMKEHDHAPLREAISALIRETDMKVLICPEDMTQMAVGREMLYDKLSADVQKRVVWREKYWLTDEALSVYVRSAGLFGLEMHSPIMCIGNGIPAIVCRFEEQTSKGFMWRDIGLGDWLFDMDQPDEVARIVPAVLSLVTERSQALEKVAIASEFVRQRQQRMTEVLHSAASNV